MNEVNYILDYLRTEIERVEKQIEEKANAKFYNDAALLQAKRDALFWAWQLVNSAKIKNNIS